MKKIFILVLVAFSLTACSNDKKVVCKDDKGSTVTITKNADNKVATLSQAQATEGVSKEEFDEGKEEMDAFFEQMMKADGIKISASHSGDTMTMHIELDFDAMDSQTLEGMGFSSLLGEGSDFDKTVERYETLGHSCK